MDEKALKDAIAQKFIFGVYGTELNGQIREILDKALISGVIFFSRNLLGDGLEALERVEHFIAEMAKNFPAHQLLISIDQEGGRVSRLLAPFSQFPAMFDLARFNDPALIHAVARIIGTELRAVGFNLDFAPVFDIWTQPENKVIEKRAFGHTPAEVIQMGMEFVAGLKAAKVLPCVKHFPGHGDTVGDSHQELPSLPHSLEFLLKRELMPFQAAIAGQIEMIMTAHVLFPRLDSFYPASISTPILRGLLRDTLHYEGVIISDDLDMAAISDHYDLIEAIVLGIKASVDLFLICHNQVIQAKIVEEIFQRVRAKSLDESLILESAHRIAHLKRKLPPASQGRFSDLMTSPSHQELKSAVYFKIERNSP